MGTRRAEEQSIFFGVPWSEADFLKEAKDGNEEGIADDIEQAVRKLVMQLTDFSSMTWILFFVWLVRSPQRSVLLPC